MRHKKRDMSKNGGYILPYTLLLMVLLINVFTLSLRLYLNEINYYKKKNNQYQMRVYDARVQRHVVSQIVNNRVEQHGNEQLYYEEASIFINYVCDYTRNEWTINVTINEQDIRLKRVYLYNEEAEQLTLDTS